MENEKTSSTSNDAKTNKGSFTKELSKDVKVITDSIKKHSPKTAAIFSITAATIWLFCLLINGLTPFANALSIVSSILLIPVVVFVIIAWKKSSISKIKDLKNQKLIKQFLLIAWILCVLSIIVSVFAMPAAFLGWNFVAILVLNLLFGLTGVGFCTVVAIMLFRIDVIQQVTSK